MTDCIFCKIASGEVPADVVYEDSDIKIFKDLNPKAPVHLLVIPRVHIQSIAHLQSNHNDVIAKIIYAAKKMAENLNLSGYKLVFNVGRSGGQLIDHLHLHLLGGWLEGASADEYRV